MIRFRDWTRGAAIAVLVVAMLSVSPVRGENVLSDVLTDQILEMHRQDMNRRLEDDFEHQKAALGDKETAERAVKLRALLKIQAKTYELLEDYDRAESAYSQALDVRPVDPIVFADRGYFYMRQSRYPDAARDFMSGSRLAPKQAVYSYGAGRAFTRMGDHAAALEQYDEAVRLAPNDGFPVLARAEALVQLNRFAEARAAYDLALKLGMARPSDRFFVYFGRGYSNIFLGDFPSAIRDMNAALTLHPGMINAMVWRGFAHEKIGERNLALDDYEAAGRIDPVDKWIRASIRRVRS